MHTGN